MTCSLACTTRPPAVTTSAASRLSQVSPQVRLSQPTPPPRVSPAMPVSDTSPPVTASPCSCVAWSSSRQITPAPAVATRRSGSTRIVFIGCRSTTSPSSHTDRPGMLCPPPRTAMGSRWERANRMASTTSDARVHLTMSAGRRSTAAFHTFRTSWYPGVPGVRTGPVTRSRRSARATRSMDGAVVDMASSLMKRSMTMRADGGNRIGSDHVITVGATTYLPSVLPLQLPGESAELAAVGRSELVEQPFDVLLHGARRQIEAPRDLAVRQPLPQ